MRISCFGVCSTLYSNWIYELFNFFCETWARAFVACPFGIVHISMQSACFIFNSISTTCSYMRYWRRYFYRFVLLLIDCSHSKPRSESLSHSCTHTRRHSPNENAETVGKYSKLCNVSCFVFRLYELSHCRYYSLDFDCSKFSLWMTFIWFLFRKFVVRSWLNELSVRLFAFRQRRAYAQSCVKIFAIVCLHWIR